MAPAPPELDLSPGPTRLMAVLNATPDSFSGDGLLSDGMPGAARPGGSPAALRARIDALLLERPDVIDLGAESTRPGYTPVPPDDQIRRLGPVLEALADAACTVPLSVDTCSAPVAEFALDHGASIVNDVSGFRRDPEIVAVAAERGATLVATHSLEQEAVLDRHPTLGGGYRGPSHDRSIVAVVKDGLAELARRAIDGGVRPDRLILDPGIGFGKDTDQNLRLVAEVAELRELGHPVLLGPSRKRFLGDVTGRPAGERLAATCAVVALAAQRGVDIVRVHDVAAARDVLAVVAAIGSRQGPDRERTA